MPSSCVFPEVMSLDTDFQALSPLGKLKLNLKRGGGGEVPELC